MRTIKFRIWDTHEKKFYEPTCEAYNGKLDMLFVDLDGDLVRQTMTGLVHESMFPDRYIKQQYIGYQDKHKVDIYEGDILQDHFDNRQEVVSFVDEYHILSGWTLRPIKRDALAGDYFTTHPSWLLGAEIIGNIYANPELVSAEVK